MKSILILVFWLITFSCLGNNVEKGEQETQKLLDAVLPLTKKLLVDNQEFFPFGEIMKSNGEQVNLSASNDRERPRSSDLISILQEHYIESAKSEEIIASALVYDVKIKNSDAIAVDLDHTDGYSVTVIVPYELDGNKLVTGEMFTIKGKSAIFN